MQRADLPWLSRLERCVRLAALGIVGWAILLAIITASTGALYIWVMTGASPIEQVRDGGLAILWAWPILALFGALQVAGAFLIESPYGPWAIAGITLCLLALWILGLRRGRAHAHTVFRRP